LNIEKKPARPAVKSDERRATSDGFTIVEVVVSLMLLTLICSSVMLVMKRNMITLGESQLRMEAFEIARENMENLLASNSIGELDDYGTSDKNPNIEWETTVEPFYAGTANQTWIRAVCSATYPDANGQPQKIELTHWLTDVSAEVARQMMRDKQRLNEDGEPNMLSDANSSPDLRQILGGEQFNPRMMN
jgi:type II secretory pathway pseudopilin PulG